MILIKFYRLVFRPVQPRLAVHFDLTLDLIPMVHCTAIQMHEVILLIILTILIEHSNFH